MSLRLLILGAGGMLGSAAVHVCRKTGIDVFAPRSVELDILCPIALSQYFDRHGIEAILNCAVRKDFSDPKDWPSAFAVNSTGPMFLATLSAERDIHLIQISTDVLFPPMGGPFDESSPEQPSGPYAISKRGGEVHGALVVRGSFIGPSPLSGWPSIMDRLAHGGTVKVGRQEKWNGITTLEFARIMARYLAQRNWIKGVRHVHGPDTTRFDFVDRLRTVLRLPGGVADNGKQRDLRLSTLFDDLLIDCRFGSLNDRITELALLTAREFP